MLSSRTAPASTGNVAKCVVPSLGVLLAYAVFTAIGGFVWHFLADGKFSAIITMGVIFQCGAFLTLAAQVVSSGSCAGISARSLALEALALCCKLSSTTWLDGYLPNDESGDWLYQAMDVCSVLVVMWLLREVLVKRRSSYQADEDSAPYVGALVIVSIVMAALFHGDMDDYPLFDSLWMCGLLLGVLAVVPQLWFITRAGGKVDPLTAHYIAMTAVARVLSGTFMWHARYDITCVQWVEGVNHAIWVILAAHLLHLFLLGDFAYIYVRTMMGQGMQAPMDLSIVYEV